MIFPQGQNPVQWGYPSKMCLFKDQDENVLEVKLGVNSSHIVQKRFNMLGKKGRQHRLRQVSEHSRGVRSKKTSSVGRTHTQSFLSACLTDCWWVFGTHIQTQKHTLISVLLYYHHDLFLVFRSFSLPRALFFASVHKQINLPSTCWRWAWPVRAILSVMNWMWEGEGCWRMCQKSGMGNIVAPFQLRRSYRTAVLITSSLRGGTAVREK